MSCSGVVYILTSSSPWTSHLVGKQYLATIVAYHPDKPISRQQLLWRLVDCTMKKEAKIIGHLKVKLYPSCRIGRWGKPRSILIHPGISIIWNAISATKVDTKRNSALSALITGTKIMMAGLKILAWIDGITMTKRLAMKTGPGIKKEVSSAMEMCKLKISQLAV